MTGTGRESNIADRQLSIGNNHHHFTIVNKIRLALMKAANPWITYRTRFLVKARQLTTGLTFTDVLGRQHSGCKGDYLVESSDGVLRIAARKIFEDVYVPLLADDSPGQHKTPRKPDAWERREISPVRETSSRRVTPDTFPLPPHLTRKSPQPYRDRRSPTPSLRSL
jgi:hypothetical protein